MRAILLAVVLTLAAAGGASAQAPTPDWPNSPLAHPLRTAATAVEPTFTANVRGGFSSASNTLLTCPRNVAASRRAVQRRKPRASEPCLNVSNNDEDMRYVNVDPGGHFDSSLAALRLPSGARVVRAYLYWGADLAPGINNGADAAAPGGADPETNTAWKTAALRIGGAGAYTAVDATAPGRDGVWAGIGSWYSQPGNRPGYAFQVRADVTRDLRAALATPKRRARAADGELPVTVANVQAGRGYNRHAGWTLLVAWERDDAPWRNLTLFDGFAYVQVSGGQQLVVGPLDFTGFETPASGDVDAHAAVWAYEGDRGITGDYLALGNLGTACSALPKMFDAANPVGNFFNGTISDNGENVTGRIPGWINQLGFDRDRLFVPEGTIPNGANGASVCLGTVGDTYFFGGIAFDTLIRAPNGKIAKSVTPTTADPGDVVTYTTTVSNPQRPEGETPTDALVGAVTQDPLPSGLDFAGFTDNPGESCSYDDATRTITCTIGRIEPDGSFSYSYRATVNAAAQGTTPAKETNTACYRAGSEDQPDAEFYGCDDAEVVVPPNPYVDLGVVKTVSDATIAPGGTLTWTITATNHGPGVSTGFTVADALPPGVGFVSATADPPLACTTPAVGSSGDVVCSAPTVPAAPAAGSALHVTISATVPPDTANGTTLPNDVTVSGDQSEPVPDPHPNRDDTETRVITEEPVPPAPPPLPEPDGPEQPPVPPAGGVLGGKVAGTRLTLRKRASRRVVGPGDTVRFRLRVRNAGEASALRVRICDRLPRGLTVVSAPGFRGRGRILCTRVSRMSVGSERVRHVTARVGAGAPRVMRNVATARAVNARRVHAHVLVGRLAPQFTG